MQVLEARSREKNVPMMRVLENDPRLPSIAPQLEPAVQRKNASLAVAVCESFIQKQSKSNNLTLSEQTIHVGIRQWSWPGRFQILSDNQRTWYLDAAHNTMSIELAVQWYAKSLLERTSNVTKILVFSHINELRHAEELLETLAHGLEDAGMAMDHVIFTTYNADTADEPSKGTTAFHEIWKRHHANCKIWDHGTIKGAIFRARELSPRHNEHVLITGSQHLVGPALSILQSDLNP